jgi:hypothetical protein
LRRLRTMGKRVTKKTTLVDTAACNDVEDGGIVEDSIAEAVVDGAQVGTDDGDAESAAGNGVTTGNKEDSKEVTAEHGNAGSATGLTGQKKKTNVIKTTIGAINTLIAATSQSSLPKSSAAGTNSVVACPSSTSPKSGAGGTDNVLPGTSSGNSKDADNGKDNKNNAGVGDAVAHTDEEKDADWETVSFLTIYFLSSSGANHSDLKYFVFNEFVFRMINQLQQKAPA